MSYTSVRRDDPTARVEISPRFIIPSTVEMIQAAADPGHGVTDEKIAAMCRALELAPTAARDAVVAILNAGWRPTR